MYHSEAVGRSGRLGRVGRLRRTSWWSHQFHLPHLDRLHSFNNNLYVDPIPLLLCSVSTAASMHSTANLAYPSMQFNPSTLHAGRLHGRCPPNGATASAKYCASKQRYRASKNPATVERSPGDNRANCIFGTRREWSGVSTTAGHPPPPWLRQHDDRAVRLSCPGTVLHAGSLACWEAVFLTRGSPIHKFLDVVSGGYLVADACQLVALCDPGSQAYSTSPLAISRRLSMQDTTNSTPTTR
jgi:hypothetical protein